MSQKKAGGEVAGSTGMTGGIIVSPPGHVCMYVIFKLIFEMGSHYIAVAGLELLDSSDPPR